jgi:hypothetical protein
MRLLSDPKNWNRIVFTISRFSGRISRKYQLTTYFQNIDQDEIEFVLKLIEKKSNYFMFLRMKTCLRVFLSIVGLIILTISILCFLYFDSLIGGIITICICALETVLLNYCCLNNTFKDYFKKAYRKIYTLLDDINHYIFGDNNMHLMLSPNLNFLALYTVPKQFKFSAKVVTTKTKDTQDSIINISTQPVIHKQHKFDFITRQLSESQFNPNSETTPSEILKTYLETKKYSQSNINSNTTNNQSSHRQHTIF